jgi:hypothetical protein
MAMRERELINLDPEGRALVCSDLDHPTHIDLDRRVDSIPHCRPFP